MDVTDSGPRTEAQWVTRDSLARALHVTAPHSNLHGWDTCPQQDYDYRDADDILAAIRHHEAV